MKKLILLSLFSIISFHLSAQRYVRVMNSSTVDLTVGIQYQSGPSVCLLDSEASGFIPNGTSYTFYIPSGLEVWRLLFNYSSLQHETYPICDACSPDISGTFTFTWAVLVDCDILYLQIDN